MKIKSIYFYSVSNQGNSNPGKFFSCFFIADAGSHNELCKDQPNGEKYQNAPVLILHGDKDTYVPVANADYAKKKLTKASSVEVKTLAGADHFIPKDRYEDIKEMLMRLPH